jgi:membrane-associated phospholipid phosphatase
VTARDTVRRRVATGLAVVLSSYVGLRTHRTDRLDAVVERAVVARHGSLADRAIGVGTDLGSVHALSGVVTLLAATGRRRAAMEVAGGGTVAWLLAQAVKPAARRERPYQAGRLDLLVSPPAGSSWPSGHAALAAAAATALWPQLPRTGRVIAAAAVTGVGVSRIYVGVHHASDVVAGVGVGVVSAGIADALNDLARRR